MRIQATNSRVEVLNRKSADDSVSLSSPKVGEGWGLSRHSFGATADEEALGLTGKFHSVFDVRRSMFDVPCFIRRPAARSAFTLLEVVIGAALMSIILVSAYLCFDA